MLHCIEQTVNDEKHIGKKKKTTYIFIYTVDPFNTIVSRLIIVGLMTRRSD